MSDTNTASEGPYCYDFPRPMVTVDAVVFGLDSGRLHVVLVERKHPPFAGAWALPGGFVDMDEPLEAAAKRELAEETGIAHVGLRQWGAFGDPGRDPRGRTVSVAYLGLVDRRHHTPRGGDDARHAAWYALDRLPALAFDHDRILCEAQGTLRNMSYFAGVGAQVLGDTFLMNELRDVYTAIGHDTTDRADFERYMVQRGIVLPVENAVEPGMQRYRFNPCRCSGV